MTTISEAVTNILGASPSADILYMGSIIGGVMFTGIIVFVLCFAFKR